MGPDGMPGSDLLAEVLPVLEPVLEAAWQPPAQFEVPEFAPRNPHRIGLSGTGLCQRRVSYQWHETPVDDGWVAAAPSSAVLLGIWLHEWYLPLVASMLPDGVHEHRVVLDVAGRQVVGHTDVLFRAPSGAWVVLDLKTVSLRWLRSLRMGRVRISPRQWWQTRAYATGCKWPVSATMLVHMALDAPGSHVVPPYLVSLSEFTSEHADEVRRWYEVAAQRDPARVFRYRHDRWWCRECPWLRRCDADTAAAMPLDVRHDRAW
jgi:PD-(D/E)XK nuclease superfamily